MRAFSIPKLRRVLMTQTSGFSGMLIGHLRVLVKSSSLNLTIQRAKRPFGTHPHTFSDNHLRTNLACNSVSDHLQKADFSMIHILVRICSERTIMLKLRRVLKKSLSKNRSSIGWFWPRSKLWNFLAITLSKCLWLPTKSQMAAESQPTDVALWSICAPDLTSLRLKSSKLGKWWRILVPIGWVKLTMILFREFMESLSQTRS